MGSAAKRYARALFDYSVEGDCVEAVHRDLGALAGLYRDCPEFAAVVDTPRLPAGRRAAVVEQLLGGRAHAATVRFLRFLDAKGRMALLPAVAPRFEALVHAHLGILKVTVLSACPLEPDQLDRITQRMEARLGQRVEADAAVDPSLVGGFRVRVGDTIHDYSLATQLAGLKRQLMTT